ncbi:hypothetical protein T484DRAFT_1758092, partial [Baffinella frigidus]
MLAQNLGFSASSDSSYVITSDYTPVRRTPMISANTLSLGDASIGTTTRVFNANPAATSSTWLQEVRLNWDLTAGSLVSDVRKSNGQTSRVDILIQQRCAVDDCSGCVNPVVQRACFATQQCTVAKCIGTVVNLERPMCSVGRLLQAGLDVDIVKMQGVWTVLTDLVSFVLRSATGVQQDGMKLEFIDEIFFSLICEAKHGIVSSMSILTSLINGIVNSADRANRAQAQMTHSEDQAAENAEAVRTLTAAATTNFLAQVALGVLYPVIVAKKTIMCQTDAFLSVFDVSGFQLRLSSGDFAKQTNSLVGKCLSEYHTESMQTPGMPESIEGLVSVAHTMAADARTASAQIPYERLLHSLDGFFSYIIGIVSGLQDVIATGDQRHCNLPDSEASDLATCTCGDTPVEIPYERAIQGMREAAFWCSGTLSLISPMGVSYIAYNPYTYYEIMNALKPQM